MINRRSLTLLFFSIWIIYLFHFNPSMGGAERYVFLTSSIVERHSINIDPYQDQTRDEVQHGGHTYVDTNPGLSMLAVPGWSVAYCVYRHVSNTSQVKRENFHFLLSDFVDTAFTSAVAGALTAILLCYFVFRTTSSSAAAIYSALLYGLGSVAFYFSCRMNQNVVLAGIMLLVYILIFHQDVIAIPNEATRLGLIGALCGASILIDFSSVAMVIVFAIYAIRTVKKPTSIGYALLAGAVLISILMIYLYSAFHNPLRPPQSYFAVGPGANEQKHGFMGLGMPNPKYMLQMLVSPSLGIFVYMPFTVMSAWVLIKEKRTEYQLSTYQRTAIGILCICQLLYISCSATFQVEFGPRYLLPLLPILTFIFGLDIANALSRRNLPRLYLLSAMGALSILINLSGSEIGIATNNCFYDLGVWLLRGPWLPILDWIKSNIVSSAGHSSILTPYGLLTVMLGIIALLWLPYLSIHKNLDNENHQNRSV